MIMVPLTSGAVALTAVMEAHVGSWLCRRRRAATSAEHVAAVVPLVPPTALMIVADVTPSASAAPVE